MKIFKEIAEVKSYLSQIKSEGMTVGLVATMGALHKGHMSLIEASRAANDATITTIYVNPTQFNNPLDLQKYPRTLDEDLRMLEQAQCDAVFCPSDAEMYEEQPLLKFDFGHLDKIMEGAFRPGHFSGVALVVAKLFGIIEPDRAYFGQKDWQQVTIIRRMVAELKFNLEVRTVPIVRDANGLAMSSRNLRLSKNQTTEAAVLFQAMNMAGSRLKNGESIDGVRQEVQKLFDQSPEMKLEYFEVTDSKNLTPVQGVITTAGLIICIAGYAGDVRLIDNMFLD
jgi:pantoate--beta-alanine ligase